MRQERTYISAVLHRDQEDPARFLIYETWANLDDVRDLELHRAYRQTSSERLPELLAAEREIGIWHPLRSNEAACLEP